MTREAAEQLALPLLDAARVVDRHPRTLLNAIRDGSLPARKASGRWVVEVADVRAWDDWRRGRIAEMPVAEVAK